MAGDKVKPAGGIPAFNNTNAFSGKNGYKNPAAGFQGDLNSESRQPFGHNNKDAASYSSRLTGDEISDREMNGFFSMLEESNRLIRECSSPNDDSRGEKNMPSLLNMTVGEATAILKANGMKASKISYKKHPQISYGLIISQLPAPGAAVSGATDIRLVVSRDQSAMP